MFFSTRFHSVAYNKIIKTSIFTKYFAFSWRKEAQAFPEAFSMHLVLDDFLANLIVSFDSCSNFGVFLFQKLSPSFSIPTNCRWQKGNCKSHHNTHELTCLNWSYKGLCTFCKGTPSQSLCNMQCTTFPSARTTIFPCSSRLDSDNVPVLHFRMPRSINTWEQQFSTIFMPHVFFFILWHLLFAKTSSDEQLWKSQKLQSFNTLLWATVEGTQILSMVEASWVSWDVDYFTNPCSSMFSILGMLWLS